MLNWMSMEICGTYVPTEIKDAIAENDNYNADMCYDYDWETEEDYYA